MHLTLAVLRGRHYCDLHLMNEAPEAQRGPATRCRSPSGLGRAGVFPCNPSRLALGTLQIPPPPRRWAEQRGPPRLTAEDRRRASGCWRAAEPDSACGRRPLRRGPAAGCGAFTGASGSDVTAFCTRGASATSAGKRCWSRMIRSHLESLRYATQHALDSRFGKTLSPNWLEMIKGKSAANRKHDILKVNENA